MGLLQSLSISDAIWEDLNMDIVMALPAMWGHSMIFVVVDHLSKYCHLGSLPAKYSVSMVADYFIREIIQLHGIPKTIIMDWDRIFLSKRWKEIFTERSTTLTMSSLYHPEMDGQTEIINKTIEQYLHADVHENLRSWIELLSWANLWHNTHHHHSLASLHFRQSMGDLSRKSLIIDLMIPIWK